MTKYALTKTGKYLSEFAQFSKDPTGGKIIGRMLNTKLQPPFDLNNDAP